MGHISGGKERASIADILAVTHVSTGTTMSWLPILRRCTRRALLAFICVLTGLVTMGVPGDTEAQAVDPAIARSMAKTQKPPLHGRKWMAITASRLRPPPAR
jgi:hypothetical protein